MKLIAEIVLVHYNNSGNKNMRVVLTQGDIEDYAAYEDTAEFSTYDVMRRLVPCVVGWCYRRILKICSSAY